MGRTRLVVTPCIAFMIAAGGPMSCDRKPNEGQAAKPLAKSPIPAAPANPTLVSPQPDGPGPGGSSDEPSSESSPVDEDTIAVAPVYDGPKAPTIEIAPNSFNEAADPDERLATAMLRYWFIGTLGGKQAAALAILAGEPVDPAVKAAHDKCVKLHTTIRVSERWPDNIDGETVRDCMASVSQLVDDKGWRKDAEQAADALARLSERGPAYGLPQCHQARRDGEIARPRPVSPDPLRRGLGVPEGATADIIVHIDKTGASQLLAVINAEDGLVARECFAAVDGEWSRPRLFGKSVDYCRAFRCAF